MITQEIVFQYSNISKSGDYHYDPQAAVMVATSHNTALSE